MRFIAVLAIIWLFLSGGQDLWTRVSNLHPQQLSCAQYMKNPDTGIWLDLSDCHVDYYESVKITGKSSGDEYYAPVRASADVKAPVLLLVKANSHMSAIASNLFVEKSLRSPKFESAAHELVQDHVGLKGIIVRGMDADSKVRDLLQKDPPDTWKLASDWKIIDVNSEPSFVSGIVKLAVGLLVLGWVGYSFTRRRKAAAA